MNGRRDFRGTVRNLLELGSSPGNLDRVLEALPRAYGHRGINLPGFALAPIRGRGLGFYAYLYRYMFGGDDGSLTVRANGVVAAGIAADDRVRRPTGKPRDARVHRRMRRPGTSHSTRATRSSTTTSCGTWWRERDAPVIARHGYRVRRLTARVNPVREAGLMQQAFNTLASSTVCAATLFVRITSPSASVRDAARQLLEDFAVFAPAARALAVQRV